MHDPMTLAFDLSPLLVVWHLDPERDGTDNSCGYGVPRVSEKQRRALYDAAWPESRNPYFLRLAQKEWSGSRVEAEAMFRALVLRVAEILGVRMTFGEAARIASTWIHRPDCVNPASVFCHLPGWHTNSPVDSPEERQRAFAGVLTMIAEWCILLPRRCWHPKWHVHHWRIQFPWLRALRRRFIDRCSHCRLRFRGRDAFSDWSGRAPWCEECQAKRTGKVA